MMGVSSLVARGTRALSTPTRVVKSGEVSDIRSLKERIRPGDVLLMSGTSRVSEVVKLLTRSPWSHVVLYVGDQSELLTEAQRSRITRLFGRGATEHLVIDADPVEGVRLKSLDENVGNTIRHCRAEALHQDQLEAVVSYSLRQLGRKYDKQHIISLMFFFAVPWELLPERIRRFFTEFAISESDTICSRVLSEAFAHVGYPIRPRRAIEKRRQRNVTAISFATGLRNRGKSALRLVRAGKIRAAFARVSDRKYSRMHRKDTRFIVPADYDLSPYFAILKEPTVASIR